MTVITILFVMAVTVATHITYTPPTTALDHERKAEPFRIGATARVKYVFSSLLLVEILAILAGSIESSVSRRVLDILLIDQDVGSRINFRYLIGASLAFCGGMIRFACYQEMGKHFTFDLSLRDHHQLITSGPYGVVRHPGYSGLLINMVGIACFFSSNASWFRASDMLEFTAGRLLLVTFVLALLVPVMVVKSRMQVEDQMLKKAFGEEWKKWSNRVPYRLVPWIY